MPHFSKDGIDNDPDGHGRLKQILHGRSVRARAGMLVETKPDLETRFGGRDATGDASSDRVRLVRVDDGTR